MKILQQLNYDNLRIINVKLRENKKTVKIEEACDQYFQIDLNKNEFGQLIDELKEIHNDMVDSSA